MQAQQRTFHRDTAPLTAMYAPAQIDSASAISGLAAQNGIFLDMRIASFQASLAALLLMAAASCGQPRTAPAEPPAPELTFTLIGPWSSAVPGVGVTLESNVAHVASSTSVTGYQVITPVETVGHSTMLLRYDITLSGGPGYLGTLKADQSAWLNQITLAADASNVGEIEVDLAGEQQVHLVLSTSTETSRGTKFTVNSVQYAFR